jgi:hypothetical protein
LHGERSELSKVLHGASPAFFKLEGENCSG